MGKFRTQLYIFSFIYSRDSISQAVLCLRVLAISYPKDSPKDHEYSDLPMLSRKCRHGDAQNPSTCILICILSRFYLAGGTMPAGSDILVS